MKKTLGYLYRANLYSFLMAVKFVTLIFWQMIQPEEQDYFGQYALCLGLTSTFFIFAGMRGRVYVFGGIDAFRDLLALSGFMAFFGVIALGIVAVLYAEQPLAYLLLLVGLSKFAEMFLDANTSYIQKVLGRDAAYRLLNQHSVMLVLSFLIGLAVGGLHAAILAEIAVLTFTLFRQARKFSRGLEPEVVTVRGARGVLWGGAGLTLAATLNSAIVTLFLYWSSAALPESSVFAIAKVLALQAFCARLITSNNIFFLRELNEKHAYISRLGIKAAFASLALLVFIWALASFFVDSVAIYCLGAAFTFTNVAGIVIRQQLLLNGVVRPLIAIHAVELSLLLAFWYGLDPGAITAFVSFTLLRIARLMLLTLLLSKESSRG